MTDADLLQFIPVVLNHKRKPVPMVWLKQADAFAAIRAAIASTQADTGWFKGTEADQERQLQEALAGQHGAVARRLAGTLLMAMDTIAAQSSQAGEDHRACGRCNGSGEQMHLSGGGPDAYDVAGPCSACKGTGEKGSAP